MKLNILVWTTDYRGDHSADVRIAYEAQENETVQQLAERLLQGSATNVIEIREVQP